MDDKDLTIIKDIHTSLKVSDVSTYSIENPAMEVEHSLVDFLKHRLSKLKQDVEFEDQIKEALVSRLSEASFAQLVTLLEVLQKNSNIGVEKVLAPFIAQTGEKTLLDSTKELNRHSQISEQVFNDVDDKNIIQSTLMLTQFLEILANAAENKKEV